MGSLLYIYCRLRDIDKVYVVGGFYGDLGKWQQWIIWFWIIRLCTCIYNIYIYIYIYIYLYIIPIVFSNTFRSYLWFRYFLLTKNKEIWCPSLRMDDAWPNESWKVLLMDWFLCYNCSGMSRFQIYGMFECLDRLLCILLDFIILGESRKRTLHKSKWLSW